MISLKIMDRMAVIMKNKECMNCGSKTFHQVENGWKCDYCGTVYLNPKKPSSKRPSVDVSPHKKNKSRIIVGVVFPIMALLLGLIFFKGNESPKQPYSPTSPAASQSKPENGFPGGWTQELYEGVVVATKNYDADNEKYSFENGSNFEELEKQVGKPDTVTSWEKEDYGMPPRASATWNKSKAGEYSGHSITITYNKNTGMITDKNRY